MQNKTVLYSLAYFLIIANSEAAFSQNSAASVWNSSEGRIHLNVGTDQFTGTYENDNGRVSGTRNGNILDGHWGEDSSGKRCDTEKLNTFYWGKIHLEFSGKSFSGKYSYCDDAMTGSWNGSFDSGISFLDIPQTQPKPPVPKPPVPLPASFETSVWNTSEGVLNLKIKGTSVTGTYSQDDGRMSGTKAGNKITGFWGETSSGTKCTTKKLNTYYWGRIEWTFTGNSFSGRYSYCDNAWAGSWTGTRK